MISIVIKIASWIDTHFYLLTNTNTICAVISKGLIYFAEWHLQKDFQYYIYKICLYSSYGIYPDKGKFKDWKFHRYVVASIAKSEKFM